jgi:hypothetical protein
MEPIFSSETSGGFQQTTRRYIPEDRIDYKFCIEESSLSYYGF